MPKEDLLKGLNADQIKQVQACNNQDELLALANAEGVELTDEQLAAVSGGVCFKDPETITDEEKKEKEKQDEDGRPINNPF